MVINNMNSSNLYHSPSFIMGVASLFNIAGNFFEFNYSKSDLEADNNAIKRDWEIVGSNLFDSIDSCANEKY